MCVRVYNYILCMHMYSCIYTYVYLHYMYSYMYFYPDVHD